jgi:hypothetical protein
MKILVASSNSKTSLEIIKQNGWGRMFVKYVTRPFDGECWGFDNGAYAAHINKTEWDGDNFLRKVDRQMKFGKPIMAVCPDKFGGGLDSLEFSLKWRDKLPNEWDWYLAVQDNIHPRDVIREKVFTDDKFKGIFLGGSTKYKFMALAWAKIAHANDKKFHYARCSTRSRIQVARFIQSDSIDSAFPFWVKERREKFIKYLEEPIQPDFRF